MWIHKLKFGQHATRENTRYEDGISWFNEDKWTLGKRVEQMPKLEGRQMVMVVAPKKKK